jgi:RecG-like helicase
LQAPQVSVKAGFLNKVGELFNDFYSRHLPFSLTNAQKNVLKEIRKDFGSGKQMNRLLQGDVGSGKTMVALLSMLIAADNSFQSVLMAPTEILAQQHYNSLVEYDKGPARANWFAYRVHTCKKKKIVDAGLCRWFDTYIIGNACCNRRKSAVIITSDLPW